ncbi:hypothetical protein ACFLU5_17980 [Bacteroidota bacterium]
MSFSLRGTFWYKLIHWEFWPWQLIYLPVICYYAYLSVKARSPYFFWLSNPGFEGGGLLIESKWDIFKKIPSEFEHPVSPAEVLEEMVKKNLHFPVILKPEYGERGWMVEKIEDSHELERYVQRIRTNFLLQEYVDLPYELGVFYYRYPEENKGTISSIVTKELLCVIGDGNKNVRKLVEENPRARLQIDHLEKRHKSLLNLVPGKGEKLELVSIGNHSRGTTFLDGSYLINEELITVFDILAKRIDGFYYGRFDIRYQSIDELHNSQGFVILELNGAKSEPAHIYQPGFPLIKAYKVIFRHWGVLYKISRINHKSGMPYPPWAKGWALWQKYRKHVKGRKTST